MRLSCFTFALAATLLLAGCGGRTNKPGPGDPAGPPGDPGGGDIVTGDDATPADEDLGDVTPGDPGGDAIGGDATPGDDSAPVTLTPSTRLCAAGSSVASASCHGVVCLSPLGSGGPVSSSASYKLIPGPAHLVEAE